MYTVAVVTDSVAGLPSELAENHGIRQIPVRITVEGHTYTDTDADLPGSLVDKFRTTPRIDTTPWPPEYYRQVYLQVGQAYRDITHVVAFSQFTSTMALARQGAAMASAECPGLRIEIIDSASTGMAQGFVALAAARAARQGATLEECSRRAREVADNVVSVFALESLDYVARTGRVNRLAAWAGSLLKVAPVVRLAHGKEHPLFLARSRRQALKRIVALVEDAGSAGTLHVAVMESDPGYGGEMLCMLRECLPLSECLLAPFTPVMRIVGGPGVVGVAFYADTTF